MKTAAEIRARMSPERQAKIAARAHDLMAEEMTLQDLRKAQRLTQVQMATALNIGQDSVSRIEKRSDLMLSTMRSYVEAMDGTLELVVRFKDRGPVVLTSLEEIGIQSAPKKKPARRKPELVHAR